VKCWGHNVFGGLGDGTISDSLTPVQVSGLTSGVKAIGVGNTHSCAVTSAGAAECWGGNGFGQLGDGSAINRSSPVFVDSTLVPMPAALADVVAITAGGNHTCALLTGSRVVCWGNNGNGQLGDGTTTNRTLPVQTSGFYNAVDAGTSHTCGITVDLVDPNAHTVRCWGDNFNGQIGDGTNTTRTSPANAVNIAPFTLVNAVSAGGGRSCALVNGGGVVECWGSGYGTTATVVTGFKTDKAAISAGTDSCAATGEIGAPNGEIYCWGTNQYGQLGNATTTDSTTPVRVLGFGGKTLVVKSAGNGKGSLKVGQSACGTGCSTNFALFDGADVTATADAGSTFGGWSGDCSGTSTTCSVFMTSDRTVTATFTLANTTTTTTTTTTTATTTTAVTTTTAAPSAAPPATSAVCTVPNVTKKALAAALTAIAKAHCASGSVKLGRSKTVKKGLVIWQSPKAGTKPKNGKVSLLVSSGR
jgi:uncharacterized repeat protein (TIGR02543 family)